jgi:isopentenyl diphosphate isomerase/L-lactate dehydrogenase-like FMN-dependent dehydrogenase
VTIVNIDDLRLAARRRLPKFFFDYIDGGSFAEETCRRNRDDFSLLRLRQTVLGDYAEPDLSTEYLGRQHPLPFMLGPVGFLGLYTRNGEQKAAIAAHAAGIPFCLSTFSIASLADLRQATDGALHFQLYMLDDRALCEEFLSAAEEAGVEALYVTVDTAITAIRERDVRNGFRSLTRVTPRLFASLCRKPGWLFDIGRGGLPSVRAVEHRTDFGRGALEQAANLSRRIDKRLAWKDIEALRDRWKGKLVIKGILSPEDATKAQAVGVEGCDLEPWRPPTRRCHEHDHRTSRHPGGGRTGFLSYARRRRAKGKRYCQGNWNGRRRRHVGTSLYLWSRSRWPGRRRPRDRDIAPRDLDYLGFDGRELDRRPKGMWPVPYIQTVTTNAGERR